MFSSFFPDKKLMGSAKDTLPAKSNLKKAIKEQYLTTKGLGNY